LVMQDLEQVIRERAYGIWMESGRPDGSAEEHWLVAQREVLSTSLGTSARVSVIEPGAPKKPAKQHKTKSKKVQVAA
jgi:Protein of unknown function (DUF2934)